MAAGSPVSQSNGRATSTRPGTNLQGAAVANLAVTVTAGSLPVADGTLTIANAATPTVAELLEYCVELETKLYALRSSLRTAGVVAT